MPVCLHFQDYIVLYIFIFIALVFLAVSLWPALSYHLTNNHHRILKNIKANYYISLLIALFVALSAVFLLYIINNYHGYFIMCDAPRALGPYFQDSPQREALPFVDLHNQIVYYLVATLFSVAFIKYAFNFLDNWLEYEDTIIARWQICLCTPSIPEINEPTYSVTNFDEYSETNSHPGGDTQAEEPSNLNKGTKRSFENYEYNNLPEFGTRKRQKKIL